MTTRLLRSVIFVGAIAVPSAAYAAPGGTLAPLPANLPSECQPLAHVASTMSTGPEMEAHLSVAMCLAEHAANAVKVTPDAAGVAALDAAVAPSFAIIDDVAKHGDARYQLMAASARADLDVGLLVRVRMAEPSSAERATVEPLLASWMSDAAREDTTVAKLAGDTPSLHGDPVIDSDVASAAARKA